MSSIKLEVITDNLKYDIPLERRITIIRGDSGVGKTTLVDLISQSIMGVQVNCPLDIIVATETTWQAVMQFNTNSLIIFDDLEIVASAKFASEVKKTSSNNNYYLIFSRENIGEKELGRLSYSMHSIYRMIVDDTGVSHTVEPFYKFTKGDSSKVKSLLVEDSKAGYEFFHKLLPKLKVYPASNGKSSIVDDSKKLYDSGNKNLLIVVDLAAYGCHIEQLYQEVLKRRKGVLIDIAYECFEELLLQSNMFKDNAIVQEELKDIYQYANKYISWETYFEDLILRASKDAMFKYSHNNSELRDCYTENCDNCNEHIRVKCTFNVPGDKFNILLKDTKYNKYLELR